MIDPSGAVLARLPEDEAAVLHAAVPRAWSPSFYRRYGDVFAIACCAAFAAAIARGISARGGDPAADPGRARQ